MACISLIVPLPPRSASLAGRVDEFARALTTTGRTVEVLAIADPRDPAVLDGLDGSFRALRADRPGKAASAYLGMREANGEVLVILDLEKGYAPDDLGRVIEPLLRGEADVVVASVGRDPRPDDVSPAPPPPPPPPPASDVPPSGRPRRVRFLGALARPLIGITDPTSGLVAVTRSSYLARPGNPTPLGSRFVLELLVGSVGRRVEVPIRRRVPSYQLRVFPSDLRLLKRLADDRFGTFSRLFQFCAVGASGMIVDLSCYALFQLLLSRTTLSRMKVPLLGTGQSLDLAVAGAMAIGLALIWNFSLNRRLTFNDSRQGSIPRQFVTYALSNALGIALSFSLRLILPGRVAFFARHRLAAAVVGIVAATGISFSMSRWVVFHHRPASGADAPPIPHRVHENAAVAAERA